MPHTGLQVRDGEVIEKGRQLQDGALNPPRCAADPWRFGGA